MNWRQRAQGLRAVPLDVVLRSAGAQPDPLDPRKWHTARGVLSVTGVRFMNWNLGAGGGGAIDLVMHLYHLSFGQALEWLELHIAPGCAPFREPPPPRPTWTLPPPVLPNRSQVKAYLTRERRLPPALLQGLFQSKSLYADARANAVFLLRGRHRQPVGAELRGTAHASAWRGMAPGSRKDLGFFAIPDDVEDDRPVVLCESAIDAISCHALYPRHRCVSTSGARPDPAWLGELLARGQPLYCGFDLDPTGEAMAAALSARHPAVRRLRPTRKDWNDVLCLGP